MFVLKLSVIQNQLPISFGTALLCKKISNVRNLPPHTQISSQNICFNIELQKRPETYKLVPGDNFEVCVIGV